MSWFNLGWSAKESALVDKWKQERGKLIPFIDETRADPQADEVSWVLGFPIFHQVSTPIFASIPRPILRKKSRRKQLTLSQKEMIFQIQGGICSECGEERGLQIHHEDEDPSNNNLDNLIILCYLCHKKKHARKLLIEEK